MFTSFQNITNQENNYSSVLKWIKETCSKLPKSYYNILIYCTLTGLRPSECFSSINPIKSDLENYFNQESMTLERIKYPEIFIPKTKKIYISIVNESIIQIANESANSNYNSLCCYF